MPWFSREEGVPETRVSAVQRIMPFIMRGRNESIAYFEQHADVSAAVPFLRDLNATVPDKGAQTGLFHVFVAATVRTLAERPKLNRFVVGQRIYRRKAIEMAFSLKMAFDDDSPVTTLKLAFTGAETLLEVAARIREAVAARRAGARTASDTELDLVMRLPWWAVRLVLAVQRALDYMNLLPAAMIRGDPLYASFFAANLGSIGLGAPFHHLFEYGTVPIFAALGRVTKIPVVDGSGQVTAHEVLPIRYSFDERIADGFYAARALEILQGYIEHPERLMTPGSPLAGLSGA